MDPDLHLVEALQAGDDSALNPLIERHRHGLFRFVFRYLRDEASAGDIVQETFVRVYFNVRRFRPKSAVKTWIYSIALNLCRDHSRRLARRTGEVSLDAPLVEQSLGQEVADNSAIPSTEAGENERVRSLARAIDQLPEKLKEALVLFSLEGHSQKEVAELLAITPKTVELRVYHAKKRLRDALGPGKS